MDIVNAVNGKTGLYGLIGDPVEHTKSPYIHNSLLKNFKINAIYVPVYVKKGNLEAAVAGMKAQNFKGFNVTVPYKKDIIKYLDDISNDALLMGAVNTVKNVDGRLKGYNTDAEGFVRDFKDGFDTSFKDKRVLILGAGGTARALAVKLCTEGVKHITIANRSLQNADNIVELIKNNYGSLAGSILHASNEFATEISNSDVIINTTPVGMSTYKDSTPFDYSFMFEKNQLVYDVVYNPKMTKLLLLAKEYGCQVRNGFGMLINQGVSAFEIWTGKSVGREETEELMSLIDNFED